MELGQYTIQIFICLVMVLGAAFVALVCDFLKRNNEHLRELTIELKIRREMMSAQTIPSVQPRMERIEERGTERRLEAPPAVASGNEIVPLQEVSLRYEAAPKMAGSKVAGSKVAGPTAKDKKRPPSAEALAAMERGARLASVPRLRPTPPPPQPEMVSSEIPIAIPIEVTVNAEPFVTKAEVIVTQENMVMPKPAAPIHVVVTNAAASAATKKDWGSLLARRPTQAQFDSPQVELNADLLEAVIAASATNSAAAAAVPAGFHEGYILSRLVQSRRPVSGLVVSIGVNSARNEDGSMPESVRQLMQSLIGPNDFACQSSSEEFLLIFPNERGAAAQRRLSQIAEQLWDFQLRLMGSFSILFSWGGVEVRSESIDEAIDSANERMQETRRGRKLLSMEPPRVKQPALRQAV